MAIEAVESMVMKKLDALLTQGLVVRGKAVAEELERMKAALEEMVGYFLEAESKWSDSVVKALAQEYLKHLYGAEDEVDTFSMRRKTSKLPSRLACLENRRLRSKIAKIRRQVLKLEKPPPEDEEASVNKSPRLEGKRRQTFDMEASSTVPEDSTSHSDSAPLLPQEKSPGSSSWSLLCQVMTIVRKSPRFKGKRRQLDAMEDSSTELMSPTSIDRDRYNQYKLMFNYSFDEEQLSKRLKDGVTNLVDQLLKDSPRHRPMVFAVHGDKGSGKTTLARAVYGNRQVKERFKSCSAWITPSVGATTESLLLMLLGQIRSSDDFSGGDHGTIDSLKERVSELFKDRQYLIVFDDVGSCEMWDNLKSAFSDAHDHKGSKILLITCDLEAASRADKQFKVEKLNDEDSWSLFLNKVGVASGHENKKHEIVQACKGLPLNLMLLGGLLHKKEYEEWPKLPSNTSDLISLCYHDLSAHWKLCLIHMVLFPKEYDVPVRRLQRLWLAEGFVDTADDAKDYFDELVKRSLIQVSKLTSDGSPKRCRLLGSLHDHLIPKAEAISLFHVHNRFSGVSCDVADPVCVRRLVEATDIKDCTLYPDKLGSLRSYMSFNVQKKDTPATEVGKVLRSFLTNGKRLLRVLDLEGVYKPSLPDNLGDFFHLRYLGLRWTFLDTLPESIGNLYYLETLDIKHTYITTLPPFIWKMKHLKHLNASEIHLDLPRNPSGSWPPLLTLAGFSVDDTSFKKDSSLKGLDKIRELEITFQLTELSNSDQLLDWISSLTAIQALRLRSKDEIGRPSSIGWPPSIGLKKPLSGLEKLTHLNLLGKLTRLPDKDEFPPMLKVLTLAISELKQDPMPTLGQLPNLTALRLLAKSYKGNKIICPAEGFKELRVLKLWMLKDLEVWDVQEGAMEKLKELNIRCCDKLKSIPEKLLKQIKELTLTNMSQDQEFIRQVELVADVTPIINTYKFTPLPWETDDEESEAQ